MAEFRTRLRRLPGDFSEALVFFSRLPLTNTAGTFDLRRSSAAWPLAGIFLALIPSAVLLVGLLLHLWAPVVALLTIAAGILLGGGLHEDGLADTADGLGGGRTREAKLTIMRDTRLGTYGALALILLVTLKATTILLLVARPVHAVAALLAIAAISRSLALWHWHATLPARRDGLAWSAGRPDGVSLAIGGTFGMAAAAALILLFGLAALVAMVMALAGTVLFTAACRRQIGGHTGDTIGASQQIAEALLLIGLTSLWRNTYWPPLP